MTDAGKPRPDVSGESVGFWLRRPFSTTSASTRTIAAVTASRSLAGRSVHTLWLGPGRTVGRVAGEVRELVPATPLGGTIRGRVIICFNPEQPWLDVLSPACFPSKGMFFGLYYRLIVSTLICIILATTGSPLPPFFETA